MVTLQFKQLQINFLQAGKYIESPVSSIFPNIPIIEGISHLIEMSKTEGTSAALRGFCKWIKEIIQ